MPAEKNTQQLKRLILGTMKKCLDLLVGTPPSNKKKLMDSPVVVDFPLGK
jgi:hypothetical protein